MSVESYARQNVLREFVQLRKSGLSEGQARERVRVFYPREWAAAGLETFTLQRLANEAEKATTVLPMPTGPAELLPIYRAAMQFALSREPVADETGKLRLSPFLAALVVTHAIDTHRRNGLSAEDAWRRIQTEAPEVAAEARKARVRGEVPTGPADLVGIFRAAEKAATRDIQVKRVGDDVEISPATAAIVVRHVIQQRIDAGESAESAWEKLQSEHPKLVAIARTAIA